MRCTRSVLTALAALAVPFAVGCGGAGGDDTAGSSAAAVSDDGTLATFHFHPGADGWDRPGFGFANATLDPVNAYWAARLSGLAYDRDDASLRRDLAAIGLSGSGVELATFRAADTDTQVFYVATKDVAVLAFKGTDSKATVQVDLEITTDSDLGASVHHGFESALLSVWGWSAVPVKTASLRDFLLRRHGSVGGGRAAKPLYLTGHSLGGALATLAYSWASNDVTQDCERSYPGNDPAVAACMTAGTNRPTIDVRGVYTFGSPRVGDADFARLLANSLRDSGTTMFRFVDGVDPVPRVPSRSDGFHHVGHIDEGDFLASFDPSDGALLTASNAEAAIGGLPDLTIGDLAVDALSPGLLAAEDAVVGGQAKSHVLARYVDGLTTQLRKSTAGLAMPSVPPAYKPLHKDECADEESRCMPDRECHIIVACVAEACAPGDAGCIRGCHSAARSATSIAAADAWTACAKQP